MRQFKIDFVKLLKGYKAGWVGISSDFKKVVVWGRTLDEAHKKAKKVKDKVYFFPSGESYANFVYLVWHLPGVASKEDCLKWWNKFGWHIRV